MRVIVVSDTHFGDDLCTLVKMEESEAVLGPKYDLFKKTAGKNNDYLVLLGDILDFSIASYDKAYECAKVFFQAIKKDAIANEIIYVAGNHDHDMWHTVQQQINVINRIKGKECEGPVKGKTPIPLRHSIPGILDDRKGKAKDPFTLLKVTANKKGPKYGGLFLDKITKPDTIFNFAYPNLYILSETENLLFTHGHYLEPYWSLSGEVVSYVAMGDAQLDIEDMAAINFPLNRLACTGVGQAGVLTKYVNQVQKDVKKGDLRMVKKYLNRAVTLLDEMYEPGMVKEWASDYLLGKARDKMVEALEHTEQTRYRDNFVDTKSTRERFKRYYKTCIEEMEQIGSMLQTELQPPTRFIFGHTHQPIALADPRPPKANVNLWGGDVRVKLYNTGGWLDRQHEGGSTEFCGAEVFIYESGKGLSSQSIR